MNEARERARELYQGSGGRMLLKDIAAQLGVAEGTLRSWKKRDNWDNPDCNVAALRKDATQRERQRKRSAQVNRKAAEAVTKNPELNEEEKDFVFHAVDAASGAQAAMRTGRYSTYESAKTAAWRIQKNPAVKDEIGRLKALKRASILTDADDLIELHMRIARADMSDFVEWGQVDVPVMTAFGPLTEKDPDTGEEKIVTKRINSVRFREHDQVDGMLVERVKIGRDGASIKLVDRHRSLDFLERFYEINPMDRHKKEYDNKRLALDERGVKLAEDKLHGISADMDAIKAGLRDIVDIINAPAPDRRLEDYE